MTVSGLPEVEQVLAVVAHPDDESFGLGAILSAFVDMGCAVGLICFTQGEASTMGSSASDLAAVRIEELRCAAAVLGIAPVTILEYPDGALAEVSPGALRSELEAVADGTDLVLVFDEGGITGHPDHRTATHIASTWAQANGVPVLAWTVPEDVAATLNTQFGAGFIRRARRDIDVELSVDRTRQLEAIACHKSQAEGNEVLWRRLELQGNDESLRYLSSETRDHNRN